MKSIYLFLTCSTSIPSRLIRLFTHDPFTHVSIAFDSGLTVMYSFARRYARLPLPAGLIEESIDRGFYKNQGDIPCAVLRLDVPDSIYYRAEKRVCNMLKRKSAYHYSIIGLLMCRSGIPLELPNQYFCSQFVGTILRESGALKLPKPASLMHPSDFCNIRELKLLYYGNLSELRALRQLSA